MVKRLMCPLLTVAVFVAAFFFYLLTAAWVPVPGNSAAFISALCFPGQIPAPMRYPLDGVIGHWVVSLAGTACAVKALTYVSALLGALAVTGIFRACVAGVRFSCLDLTGIRAPELERVKSDISATSGLAGLAGAVVGAVTLPIWTMGTRPLPGTVSALLAIALLTFAMGCRWRTAASIMNEAPRLLRLSHVLTGAVFGFAVFLGTTAPTLILISLLGILLVGGPLVARDTDRRLTFVPWILLGVLGGIGLSVFSVWQWHQAFNPGNTLPATTLWVHWMQGALPSLTQCFFSFEGAAPLALTGLGAALLLGCFPKAFLRFGAPFIGQITILGLMAIGLLRWPAQLWDMMSEPSALDITSVALAMVLLGILLGSWVRNWLDVNTHRKLLHAHAIAALIVAVPTLGFTAASLWVNHHEASGIVVQNALEGVWQETDARIPQKPLLWWMPEAEHTGVMVRHLAKGGTVLPLTALMVKTGQLPAPLAQDPVAQALAAIGPEPLHVYLQNTPCEGVVFLEHTLPNAAVETLGEVAAKLEATNLGTIPMGQRIIKELRTQAARALLNHAATLAEPEDVLDHTRRAFALDPENPAAALSLDALGALPSTPDNPSAALLLQERFPWLLKPIPSRAAAYELLHGTVNTPAFHAARRLNTLCRVDYDAAFQAILEAPSAQSARTERLLMLCKLPEADIYKRLTERAITLDEVVAYLCAYPLTERAKAFYADHRKALRKHDCLTMLYDDKLRSSGRRPSEKVLAFFLRDGHFPYALFYVNLLLQEGKLEEAARFVSGFNLSERLADAPALSEALRMRVLEALTRQNPQAALETARTWLRADPWQPTLWTLLISNPAQTNPIEDVQHCLANFPLHPEASQRFAQALRTEQGDAAAERYLAATARARRVLFAKEPHANR